MCAFFVDKIRDCLNLGWGS